MANPVTVQDFTTETLDGTGVFDVMTRSMLIHLKAEFSAGRITGPEYASVYLGALQGTQSLALDFVLKKDETSIRLEALEIERDKALVEKELIQLQVDLAQAELARADLETSKLEKEILSLVTNISLVEAQIDKLNREDVLIDAQVAKVEADKLLVDEEITNATKTRTVIIAQECKLRAEFDVLVNQAEKVISETGVLNQKKVTEAAQTQGEGVADKSVIGRQMELYKKQSDGFLRDAEQKAAKIMADTWSVRRTTDEGVVADTTNKLNDTNIGKAIATLLTGVNAS